MALLCMEAFVDDDADDVVFFVATVAAVVVTWCCLDADGSGAQFLAHTPSVGPSDERRQTGRNTHTHTQ